MSVSSHTGAPAGVPTQLGEFRILDVLGEGGSGIVYTAEWGHRVVALKVLRPTLIATQKEHERFIDEARLLADITHRSVVKVLNFGSLPDGRPYLAMEKLAGESLATRLRRGRMTLGEAFNVFSQLVSAVDALHQRGLVHRDLKPENVMLVDGGRFAILLDFGIAKTLDAPESTVTQAGGIRGTPAYMAPERFFGSPASPASDIYELAVVMYAMLVGRLPWDVYTDPDARLNPTSPTTYGVTLPGTLEPTLRGALSTRPDKRPSNVQEMLRLFQRAVDGQGGAIRQTADLASGAHDKQQLGQRHTAPIGQIVQAGQPAQVHNTTPARNMATPEFAQTMLAAPTPQTNAPAHAMTHAATYARDHTSQPHHTAQTRPAAHNVVAPQNAVGAQNAGHAQNAFGTAQAHQLPLLHTPQGHIPPTQSGTIQARSPVWPTLMVAGSILVLAAALLVVFWPRNKSQATQATTPAATAAAGDAPVGKQAKTKPTKAKKEKSAGDILTEKLAEAFLSSTTSKQRPPPTGKPPIDMHYMPSQADAVISARIRAMAKGTAFTPLLKKLHTNERFKLLFDLAKSCNIDLLDTVDRITLARSETVGGNDDDDDEFDMIMAGTWTRVQVESCLTKTLKPATISRVDALTKVRDKSATSWLAWIDDHTFIYSSRKQADAAWMRKRLAKQASFHDRHGKVTGNIDQHADVWIAGIADALSDEPFIKDAPKPKLMLVNVYVARDLKGKGWMVFKDARDAAVAAMKVKTELSKLKKEDGGFLYKSFQAKLNGDQVVLSGEINSLFASLGAGVLATALDKPDKPDKKK